MPRAAEVFIQVERHLAADWSVERPGRNQRRRRARDHAGVHRRKPGTKPGLAGASSQGRRQGQLCLLLTNRQADMAVPSTPPPRAGPGRSPRAAHSRWSRAGDPPRTSARHGCEPAELCQQVVRPCARSVPTGRANSRQHVGDRCSRRRRLGLAAIRGLGQAAEIEADLPSVARSSVSCGASSVTARGTTRPNSSE